MFRGGGDNIIGILSVKDVLRAMSTEKLTFEDSVTDFIRDCYFVPETKGASELFEELRSTGNQMAMVVDEYGGLSGLVTLKRLLEAVVGPVGEEGEALEEEFEAIDENTFQLEASMSIAEANDELEIGIPDGDFDTVAGFVLAELGHIPAEGEQFDFKQLKFEIVEMNNFKIETVRVTKLHPAEDGVGRETDPR